ncbi:unnamed protein product (macronuclear) [Paramecium tetraurelia]|uniref:RING-type domain-containing protein n=1 Tax=Paramecium tetraurelia TaxID=5888 RepID=A0D4B5_PARTE|nr:uncharacterized protein GSPATT00013348001 [Paramecium tetraurelia]CAK77882.1 unnamed protein product [Paramecium tetraurelia]|eukprot:XP_001445279.1 hypothetical protein (macronuclear) [Paramecium tetraurelia strain d4-2]
MFLQIQSIFLSVCCATQIYQKTFETVFMEFSYKLDSSKAYMIQVNEKGQYQLTIKKFPDDQSCLPYLEVNSTSSDVTETLYDEQGYATKSKVQSISVQSDQIQISVSNKKLTFIPESNLSQVIQFTITIIDSVLNSQNIKQPPEKLVCNFPSYGLDCQQNMEEIETEYSTTLIVPKYSWNYVYYILDNYDYKIEAESDWASFVVALLPIDKANTTILPSFQSNLILLSSNGDSKEVKLLRPAEISSYIFAIGVYNLDDDAAITLTLHQQSEGEEDSFPLWAILTIVGVFILGILISIFIICQIRKQAKVYEEQPKISLDVLDKYMPIKPVPKHQLTETCCVCLVQFLKRDQTRETPCKHYFHTNCLRDWTKKNTTCPVCRQELGEADIQKYLCLSQMTHKNEIDNSNSHQGELPKIPLTQLRISDHDINTRGLIIIDNSPSNQHSHSDRLSLNLIEDQIVEN